jgi:hypothetical protein
MNTVLRRQKPVCECLSQLSVTKINLTSNFNFLGKLEIMNPGQRDFKNENEPFSYPCNCLPDCMNYYYPIESSESVLATVAVNNKDMI